MARRINTPRAHQYTAHITRARVIIDKLQADVVMRCADPHAADQQMLLDLRGALRAAQHELNRAETSATHILNTIERRNNAVRTQP